MSYYNDESKITFDEAEAAVARFLREYENRRSRVNCRDVARAFDIEDSHHNLIRINDALDAKLEVVRPSGSQATQFRLERP